MEFKRVSSNATVVLFVNGVQVLFLYNEPVAAYKLGLGALKTSKELTKTTQWHVREWLFRNDWEASKVPQEYLDRLIGAA
jgi:hypothetical protein